MYRQYRCDYCFIGEVWLKTTAAILPPFLTRFEAYKCFACYTYSNNLLPIPLSELFDGLQDD